MGLLGLREAVISDRLLASEVNKDWDKAIRTALTIPPQGVFPSLRRADATSAHP